MSEEIERLLWHMPAIVECTEDEWVRGFASSIVKRRHWKSWQPSEKQINVMRRLVKEHLAQRHDEGFLGLTEDYTED